MNIPIPTPLPYRASRRGFLSTSLLAAAGLTLGCARDTAAAPAKARPAQVQLVEFSNQGKRLRVVTLPTIARTEAQWRKQLSPTAYTVARKAGTERPYSGQYNDHHAAGVYRCVCCATALFDSRTKFDSGTGWPSFWQPIAKQNVVEHEDRTLGMARTEVLCRRCDAHLGHVFTDGPRPTGLRYCMNSVSLQFSSAA